MTPASSKNSNQFKVGNTMLLVDSSNHIANKNYMFVNLPCFLHYVKLVTILVYLLLYVFKVVTHNIHNRDGCRVYKLITRCGCKPGQLHD